MALNAEKLRTQLPADWLIYPTTAKDVPAETVEVMVILHGFMGCPEDFTPLASVLRQRFHCILPMLPGHGGSTPTFPLHLSAQATWIAAQLQEAGIQRYHGVGYSLGGRVALTLAAQHPVPPFLSLRLIACHVRFENITQRWPRFAQDQRVAERLRTLSWRDFLDGFWYRLPLFGQLRQHPAYAELLQRRMSHDPQRLAEVVLQASSAFQPDYNPLLETLNAHIPVQYFAGSEDPKYTAIAQRLKQKGIDAQVIKNAGHCVHVEQLQDLVRSMKM